MWAKTLAETDRSDIPRYLVQSDFAPFPFQSGRIMARFQSVGMTQYFHMSVKRGSSQLMTGAPPDLSSSAVIPQIPGALLFFSFRIAADISSAVGGVESTEVSWVALAASAMRTGSSGGAGLLNCSWKWSPVDNIIYSNFQKAFDKVPHQRLTLKLKSHGMGTV